MDKKTTIYLSLGTLLALASCSQENPGDGALRAEDNIEDNRIYFRSYLPSVTESRAGIVDTDKFNYCQVTCLNPDDDTLTDPTTGKMTPYFTDIRFAKEENGRFISQGTDTCKWPDSQSRLHFFAYHPSLTEMNHTGSGDYFNLINSSTSKDGNLTLDYRLKGFKVATEIAKQVDFLSAYASGSASESATSGIALDFKHQMARVELSAWSGSDKYDFDIAGVRIGNAITEGDFHFPNGLGEEYPWSGTEGKTAPVEHIFTTGESIVKLSKQSGMHASENDAASVMGSAGPAMVIPMKNRIEAWEGKSDPAISNIPYTTDRLYFSLLVRVTNLDGETVYPYPNDKDNIPQVYLVVEDGKINRRVYRFDGTYYTSDHKDETNIYSPNANEEILGFCWAALPVAAKWEAGKIYGYKLNYSNGIGWQDPDDPNPGDPIIERGRIPFEVTVAEWTPAADYNPDLEVPKR